MYGLNKKIYFPADFRMNKEFYRLIWIPDNAMYLYFHFLFRDITQNVPEYWLEKSGILAYFV